MAKDTARDKIWTYAMTHAIKMADGSGSPIEVKHVRNNLLEAPSDRTIRDVLNTMVEHGWLEKEKEQSRSWTAGKALESVELEDVPGNQIAGVDAIWDG